MPFFSRPDLNDIQFKQSKDSVLTLSGQTQIASISGLTINDGNGKYIPIIVTGGTNFKTLTFVNDKLILTNNPNTNSIYTGASPTTCTVGGLQAGSQIFGCSISNILEKILVPTLYPNLIPPFSTFSIIPSNLLYEVGTVVKITGTTCFNRGCICPSYGTSGYRSGLPDYYEYNAWGNVVCVDSSSLVNIYNFPSRIITSGNNVVSSRVWYEEGEQPKDSSGNNYSTPLPYGCTNNISYKICGIYPYFYGKVSSGGAPAGCNRPVPNASMIVNGNKVVANSNGTICINFNSSSDDYIWFAIPESSTSKTCWYINGLNNGNIGGSVSPGGNLFPSYVLICNVSTSCWYGQNYKIYLSNYQTSVTSIMELRNN